ncbi:hypothetical protein L1887_35699 [Cichorium endivia]|nr:hypothetical protein L1887_35699 [Cichorium endivia]
MVKSSNVSNPNSLRGSTSQNTTPVIASCNFQADFDPSQYDESIHIILEFLMVHHIHHPFTSTTNRFPIMLHASTIEISHHDKNTKLVTIVLNSGISVIVTKLVFLEATGLPPTPHNHAFQKPLIDDLTKMLY